MDAAALLLSVNSHRKTGLCKTTHTKSGNNDDKPSGKWTLIVQQENHVPPSPCLGDKSYPAVNILRIIELIVICKLALS